MMVVKVVGEMWAGDGVSVGPRRGDIPWQQIAQGAALWIAPESITLLQNKKDNISERTHLGGDHLCKK